MITLFALFTAGVGMTACASAPDVGSPRELKPLTTSQLEQAIGDNMAQPSTSKDDLIHQSADKNAPYVVVNAAPAADASATMATPAAAKPMDKPAQ